ncbi:hypothetical protein A5893_17205 [Pedobacter psychrophilus]|uniref:Uncharacterized protein n=1 Tax=Pedobacter psychrophilus TaxID=1826909 RepID=A0A179DRF8_9SPHI|nr:hypothetical protein [Pedobacter psychrophilus]OAQ43498.1 hypothetical protein A5893_17205 [Pedobacter psychrophilus]
MIKPNHRKIPVLFFKIIIVSTLILLLFQLFEVYLYLLAENPFYILFELLSKLIWLILIITAILSAFITIKYKTENKLKAIFIAISPFLILTLITKEYSSRIDFFIRNKERQVFVNKILNGEIKYKFNHEKSATVFVNDYKYHTLHSSLVVIENIKGLNCIYFPVHLGLFTVRTEGFVYIPIPDSSIISDFKLNTKYEHSEIFYNPITIYKLDEHWFYVVNGEFEMTFPN